MTETQVRSAAPPAVPTILTLVLGALVVVGQLYVTIPLVAPIAADWRVEPTAIPAVATSFALCYAAGFLVVGPLCDRYGPRRLITVGLALTSVATAAVAAAPSLAAGVVLCGLQGLVASTFAPSAFAYLTTRLPPASRATAVTALTTAFFVGALVGQVGAQLLGAETGWRGVYVVSAALCAGVAVLARRVLVSAPPVDRAAPSSLGEAVMAMARLLRVPRLLLLYAATSTLLGSFVAVYLGLQLVETGVAVTGSAELLALRMSALPAMLLVPLAASRLGAVPDGPRVAGGLGVAGLCVLAVSLTEVPPVVLAGGLFVFVAALAATAPALVANAARLAAPASGAGVALYTFSMFVGASAGAQVAAALAPRGFDLIGLLVAAGLLAGAGAAYTALGRPRTRG